MEPNPVLQKLGFSNSDRLAIIHADDIGMCHASLLAYTELLDGGLVTSAATMVPCPWFPSVAAFCRQHSNVDMGVHFTLNSEWEGYRWGPVSTRDPASGMIDAEGYFHQWQPATHENADPDAVKIELEAQLERALAAGIDATHADTHMGTVAHPKFIPAYVQIALQHQLPVMVPRLDETGFQALGMDSEAASTATLFVRMLEEQGIPLLDHVTGMELDKPENRIGQARELLGKLPPGITHFIIHPSIDTPELRAITPDWPSRVADFQTFGSGELSKFIKNEGIQLIGYRAIRQLIRV